MVYFAPKFPSASDSRLKSVSHNNKSIYKIQEVLPPNWDLNPL